MEYAFVKRYDIKTCASFAGILFVLLKIFVSDYLVDVARISPSSVSDNTLRHIMQLVSLGTGLRVPPPLTLRYREKALKRARLSYPRSRHPDFVLGSEFLGKRSSDKDGTNDKRMGSEFLGKRMGSEFLGKRMGSEFLGKRMGSEFLGKRMGSEFLGKREGSEFSGKRMGSEFLGKRMGSEFLGKRYDNPDNDHSLELAGDKRMGSEFLGKRSDDYQNDDIQTSSSMEHPDSINNQPLVFSENKRMGSEFLGRRRREVKPSESLRSEA